MIGPLSARVATLCDELARDLQPGPLRDAAGAARVRAEDPLRIAVAGRLKAGKSTLVNGLLGAGEAVAPTGRLETTKVVTWFRHGRPARAVVRAADGSEVTLDWAGGGPLPPDLPASAGRPERIDVTIPSAVLGDLTVIDTPGLGTMTAGVAEQTLEVLAADSSRATSQADALLYVIDQTPRADEADVLASFRAASGLRLSALNAVGVLNKADAVCGGAPDAMEQAARLAAEARTALRGLVADVLPVSSLLGETAEVLTEADADALAAIAALPDSERVRLLLTVRRFLDADPAPVDTAARERLMGLLGLYGIARCVEWIGAGQAGASALSRHLREHSGLAALRRVLDDDFRPRADALKAEATLAALERASRRLVDEPEGAEPRRVRAAVERVRLEPGMTQLVAVATFQRVASGEIDMPPELSESLERLAGGGPIDRRLGVEGGSPEEVDAAVGRESERWLAFGNAGGLVQRNAADAVVGVLAAIDEELQSGAGVQS